MRAETAGSLWCVVLWARLARAASLVPRAVNRGSACRLAIRSKAARPRVNQAARRAVRRSVSARLPGSCRLRSRLAPRQAPTLPVVQRAGFGLPNLRRNVCPHFMTGTRGAIPIQAPHLLKALIRQDTNVSRCQLRGGVHLEQGYVNDVCLTPRFNQCVFYEDELTRE